MHRFLLLTFDIAPPKPPTSVSADKQRAFVMSHIMSKAIRKQVQKGLDFKWDEADMRVVKYHQAKYVWAMPANAT